MLEKIGDVTLTDEYWDCDCEDNYINPVSLDRCEDCGAHREQSPDSHLDEVLEKGLPVKDMRVREVEKRQFTKATLPILDAFETRLFEFHQDADLADIIPHGFRLEWASAMDRLQMILMAARTLCREDRQTFDFAKSLSSDKCADLENFAAKRMIWSKDSFPSEILCRYAS